MSTTTRPLASPRTHTPSVRGSVGSLRAGNMASPRHLKAALTPQDPMDASTTLPSTYRSVMTDMTGGPDKQAAVPDWHLEQEDNVPTTQRYSYVPASWAYNWELVSPPLMIPKGLTPRQVAAGGLPKFRTTQCAGIMTKNCDNDIPMIVFAKASFINRLPTNYIMHQIR